MRQVQTGDTVKIHYTGSLQDGRVFVTSRYREPIEFTIGSESVLPSFGKGVIGMKIGESKVITIPPEEAYGPRYEELIVEVEKADFPKSIKPTVGQRMLIKLPNGEFADVTITELVEDTVKLDANHPLAGHTLFIDIELLEIT